MEGQNVVNYKEALRALWDLEAAPPEDGDTEYFDLWVAQKAVIQYEEKQIAAQVGYIGLLHIFNAERKAWQAEQKPKAEA